MRPDWTRDPSTYESDAGVKSVSLQQSFNVNL